MTGPHVLVVSDRPIISIAYKELLEREGFPVRIDDGSDGNASAPAWNSETRLLILDMWKEDLGGPERLSRWTCGEAAPRVIVVAEFGYSVYLRRLAPGRIHGTLTLRASPATILRAVRAVIHGETFFAADDEDPADLLERLTDRELEVLFLSGRGFRPRQIADRLGLSVRTVNRYRENMREKLPVPDMAAVDALAGAIVTGTLP